MLFLCFECFVEEERESSVEYGCAKDEHDECSGVKHGLFPPYLVKPSSRAGIRVLW